MNEFLLSSIPEWKDEIRCLALFGPLPPSEEVNPSAWQDKVSFWRHAILSSARAGVLQSSGVSGSSINTSGGVFTLSYSSGDKAGDLSQRFSRRGFTPRCLLQIWDLMVSERDLVALSQFTSAPESGASSVRRVVNWTLKQTLSALSLIGDQMFPVQSSASDHSSSPHTTGHFVLVPLVKDTVRAFMDGSRPRVYYTDYLYTMDEFRLSLEACSGIKAKIFTDQDALIAARYMERLGLAVVSLHNTTGELFIKLKRPGRVSENVLSQADIGVLTMRKTMSTIEMQMLDLRRRIDDCTLRARKSLADKHPEIAKRHLRSRKVLEKLCEERADSHFQLESVMLKLQHIESEAEILTAFESGAHSLSSLMKQHGLSVDRVDETMASLQEVLSDNEDINIAVQQLNQGVQDSVNVDEESLEQELAGLIAEEKVPVQVEIPVAMPDFPAIPTGKLEDSGPVKNSKNDELSGKMKSLEIAASD
eukprot:Partr_v1_DN28286_c2_g1_i4_m75622 putative Charged multivesicular body protein